MSKQHKGPYAYGQPYVHSVLKIHLKFKTTYKLETLKQASSPDGREFIGKAQMRRSMLMLLLHVYLSASFS